MARGLGEARGLGDGPLGEHLGLGIRHAQTATDLGEVRDRRDTLRALARNLGEVRDMDMARASAMPRTRGTRSMAFLLSLEMAPPTD